MRRFLTIALLVLVILTVVVVGAGLWLSNDEAFLKTQLTKYTLEFTGRELTVDGPLDVQLGRQTTLDARDIRFENAPWSDSPDMVRLGHLRVTVDIPSLFGSQPYIPFIQLEDCLVDLESNNEGQKNWDIIAETETPEPVSTKKKGLLPVLIDQLHISDCQLRQNSPAHEEPLAINIAAARLERVVPDRLEAELAGTINEDTLQLDGWLAPASAFNHGGQLRYEVEARSGEDSLQISGEFADLDTLSQPNFQGHYFGPDIGLILARLGLPAFADGAFDVRAALDSRENRVKIDIDADVGTLDVRSQGELDKLLQPSNGHFNTQASGPDLQALGDALGIEGLVPGAFDWSAAFEVEKGIVHVENARLATEMDEAMLSGTVSTREGMPDSSLTLSFHSDEFSRWGPLIGKSWEEQGAVELTGQASTNAEGILTIDATVEHEASRLHASGDIGALAGPYDPDLNFEFQSRDMPRLAGLMGLNGFPAGLFDMKGHIRKTGQEILVDNVETTLDGHRVTVGGSVMLEKNFAGSDIDVHLEIPDLAAFGRLFGQQNLPAEHVLINGSLKPVGDGLAIRVTNSEVGEIRLDLDAEIPDLEEPTGIDANFDIHFPDEEILKLLMPRLGFPKGPLAISGGLVRQDDRTRAHQVLITLGPNQLNLDGHITRDHVFDFDLQFSGPDAGEFENLVGTHPGNVPFDISAQLHGSPKKFEFNKLSAKVGKSVAAGNVTVELADITRVSGAIKSPYLNISTWTETEDEPAPEATTKTKQKYKFDDTPVMRITDLGVEVDLDLTADTLDLGSSHIDNLDLSFVLRDNLIQFKPFSFRDSGGALLSGAFTLDSQGGQPQFDVSLLAEEFHPIIGAKEGQDPATLPSGDFELVLNSTGETRRELASNMDGKVRMQLGPGKLAPAAYGFLMTDFLGQLVDTLNPFTEAQEYTELDCAVAAADIESGVATLAPIILHTKQLTIVSEGTIDLNTEKLDITFNSKQRKGLGISATDLVNPFIKVGGTLVAPSIILDPKSTVVKGGIAVATFGISILANSLAERFLSSKDPCGDAIREVDKREQGGP